MKTRLPSNWRDRIEVKYRSEQIRKNYKHHIVTIRFKKGKTPKGFYNYIGDLYADENGFIEDSEVTPRMRRRGLGKLMYEEMLKNVGQIQTQLHNASSDAQRVWKSLSTKYPEKTKYDLWSDIMEIKK